jgi:hypothetical protein
MIQERQSLNSLRLFKVKSASISGRHEEKRRVHRAATSARDGRDCYIAQPKRHLGARVVHHGGHGRLTVRRFGLNQPELAPSRWRPYRVAGVRLPAASLVLAVVVGVRHEPAFP